MTNVTRDTIEQMQLNKLNQLLKREKDRNGFYRDLPEALTSLKQLQELPFTTAEDLIDNGARMLIRSQGDVEKIISERTSGTTGVGKRVFYTKSDCEHTIELFMAGLGELIFPGSVTMIAMPFSGPMGLGELIAEAVQRLGAEPLPVGVNKTYRELSEIMACSRPDTYVGMPAACLSMLRMCGKGSLRRALISGDACPRSVTEAIEKILGSKLWPHYGSREMGLGGAISCPAHEGMHLRENHIIPEIIDAGGHVLEDGEWGELVITTIGMEAQPLIRYRTGDYTRILPGICPCKSAVKRLDTVKRLNEHTSLRALDEVLFHIPEVVDYSAEETEEGLLLQVLLTEDTHPDKLSRQLMDYPINRILFRKAAPDDRIFYKAKRVLLYISAKH